MYRFWRMIYPIIIYMTISAIVLLLFPFPDAVSSTMTAALVTIPALGAFFIKDQRMRGQSLFGKRISFKTAGCIAAFGMGACLTVNNIIEIIRLPILFTGYGSVADQLYSPPLWIQFLGIGIVIPVVEELIFRGLGYARLRDTVSFYGATVLSSLLFAVYHGNVVQGVYAFVLGMCMCWLYEHTGTVLAPVLFHQAANLLSVAITAVPKLSEAFNMKLSLYIMTLAAAAVWWWSYRQIKKNLQEEVQL